MTMENSMEHQEAKLLTLRQAAKYINVSYSTVLRLVQDNELRAFRIRKTWRTSSAACDEYITKGFAEREIERLSIRPE